MLLLGDIDMISEKGHYPGLPPWIFMLNPTCHVHEITSTDFRALIYFAWLCPYYLTCTPRGVANPSLWLLTGIKRSNQSTFLIVTACETTILPVNYDSRRSTKAARYVKMVETKQKGDEHVKTEEQSTEWYAFLEDAEDRRGGMAIKISGEPSVCHIRRILKTNLR